MIKAIVPLPNRLPVGSLINGNLTNRAVNLSSGRDIRIPPLQFFKLFIESHGMYYELVVATDSKSNVLNYLKQYQIGKQIVEAIFLPISIKCNNQYNSTLHLFSTSINQLLRFYNDNTLFDILQGQLSATITSSIVQGPFFGVMSLYEHCVKVLRPILDSTLDHNHCTHVNDKHNINMHLTPVNPELVFDTVYNINWCYDHNTDTYNYQDMFLMCEDGVRFDEHTLITQCLFKQPIDPLSKLAIMQGFLTSSDILKYCATGFELQNKIYENISINYIKGNANLVVTPMDIASNSIVVDELNEILNKTNYTDFELTISDNLTEVKVSHFLYQPITTSLNPKTNEEFVDLIRVIKHYYKHYGHVRSKNAVISVIKNWLNEIFIITDDNGLTIIDYVSEQWLHISSSNLINSAVLNQYITR